MKKNNIVIYNKKYYDCVAFYFDKTILDPQIRSTKAFEASLDMWREILHADFVIIKDEENETIKIIKNREGEHSINLSYENYLKSDFPRIFTPVEIAKLRMRIEDLS